MRKILAIIGLLTYVSGQLILPADPYDLIKHEKMIYTTKNGDSFEVDKDAFFTTLFTIIFFIIFFMSKCFKLCFDSI